MTVDGCSTVQYVRSTQGIFFPRLTVQFYDTVVWLSAYRCVIAAPTRSAPNATSAKLLHSLVRSKAVTEEVYCLHFIIIYLTYWSH